MAGTTNSRSTRTLGALAALCFFGAPSSHAQSQAALQHSHGRHLQTGTAGTPVYVEMTDGEDIISSQYDGAALTDAELGPTSATADSIELKSSSSGAAEYEIWTTLPSDTTGGLNVNVVAQLGTGGVAFHWKVDLYEFVGKDDWTNIGDLQGAAEGGWEAISISAPTAKASNFIDLSSNELLDDTLTGDPTPHPVLVKRSDHLRHRRQFRIYAEGATSQETIYVDRLQLFGDDGSSPVPSPTPAPVPVDVPTSAPVPVGTPVAPTTAPVPVTVPVAIGTGTVGTAVYVERVGSKGEDILSAQSTGTPIVGAENAATSVTASSIEFTSTTAGVAEYEVYFTLPEVLTAGLTVSVVAQLGTGATAGNWKVDLYEFAGSDDWVNLGDLTGVAGSWSTVNLALASGASQFVESTANELLVRVYTSGADSQETIYVDQIQIFGGATQPSPTPAPVTVGAPTVAPVVVVEPTAAPVVVVSPTTAPVEPGAQQRWSAFAQFVPDWDAWKLKLGNGVCDPLEECRTDSACCGGVADAVCGNGMCEETETRDNCNKDCSHTLSVCGNGVCENGASDTYHNNMFEDEYSCPVDCGSPSSNLEVSSSVTGSCFMSGAGCDVVCGDGICSGSDTCTNCPRDCGECVATAGDGICSYPFEAAGAGDCAGSSITNFITFDGEDYATIDNAVVFDDDFEDASCTSAATAVPAGWRLADWDASVGLRLVTDGLAKFDTGCLVFNEGNAVSTETGLQGDNETGCGIIPIVRYNGNKFAIALENCASRLMIQRIKTSGSKTCPTCSNGSMCNTLTGTCACNGMWTGPGCDRAIGDFSVPSAAASWYKPALGTTWEWQIDGAPIPGSNGAGNLYSVELYDIDYSYSSSVVADLKSQGKKVMCYISAGTSEDFREDINLFPAIAKGGIVSFGEGDTFADEAWLDLRRLDVIAPIMLERLDIMAARGCDAVEWDNADLPVHDTGLSDGGQISVSVQIAYNAWIAAQTHARGMGVAMKNNNEAAAFHVDDYDMVVNEECWINGNCSNYWPWIKANKPILNTEYFTARCMYCTQANLMDMSTIKKVPDLTSCRVDCKEPFSSTQCDAASISGTVSYPIDWTVGSGAVMNTDWCAMTTNVDAEECSATRFATCDPEVGY